MKQFNSLIKKIDEILATQNPVEYEKLQPPLSDEEIERKSIEIGVESVKFKSIYQWKNGEEDDTYCEIMKYGSFLSLNSIAELKKSSMYEYNPSFIPLISEGEQMLLFNTNSGKHFGKIYLYSVPQLYIDYPISFYDSLEAMITTTIEAYQNKIYFYDFDEKELKINTKEFKELAKSLNQDSAYWTKHDTLRYEEWYEM